MDPKMCLKWTKNGPKMDLIVQIKTDNVPNKGSET